METGEKLDYCNDVHVVLPDQRPWQSTASRSESTRFDAPLQRNCSPADSPHETLMPCKGRESVTSEHMYTISLRTVKPSMVTIFLHSTYYETLNGLSFLLPVTLYNLKPLMVTISIHTMKPLLVTVRLNSVKKPCVWKSIYVCTVSMLPVTSRRHNKPCCCMQYTDEWD